MELTITSEYFGGKDAFIEALRKAIRAIDSVKPGDASNLDWLDYQQLTSFRFILADYVREYEAHELNRRF